MIKKNETIYIILGIAIIALLAIAGFFLISLQSGSNNTNASDASNVNVGNSNTAVTNNSHNNITINANTGTAASQTISITAKQWEFDPKIIRVKKGQTVIFKIQSIDVAHGFSIPEFDIDETLSPGKITTVSFVADKGGSFSFACSVFCGRGHSEMTGQLIVE